MKLTTLCYIENNDKYLMLHRIKKKEDVNEGKWIGVGGKFEEGESPEECLYREVFEETGLTIEHHDFKGIVTFVSDSAPAEYMFLYTVDKFSGELKECDEGELCWVKKSDIFNLPMWEGDKLFFELMEKNSGFFSLKLEYESERLVRAFVNGAELK